MLADSSREFLRLVVKVGGGVLLLLALLFVILFAYVSHEKRKWDNLTDTHDLKQRAAKMGEGYVASHPQAALVIGVTQRGRRAVTHNNGMRGKAIQERGQRILAGRVPHNCPCLGPRTGESPSTGCDRFELQTH